MAISLKHLFTSAKADGPDSTLIQPSNWNAEHVLTMATARLLGRTTAATGATEEISVGTGLTLSAGSLSVTTSTYQPLDADLTAIAALVSAADRLPYFTGSGTAALATFTAAGRALVDDADAAAQRTTLGLGTAATLNVGTAANNVVQLNGSAQLPAVDGSLLTNLPASSAIGRLLRAPQILTSGTSYTTPAGCNSVYVEAVGAGGGGGGADGESGSAEGGGGGGSGAYAAKFFTVSPSTAYTYAIGAGGTAGGSGGTDGGDGGNTTFAVGATTLTANGGGLGSGAKSTSFGTQLGTGGSGGSASNGDINITGKSGQGGAGGGGGVGSGGTGGPSFFGGSGRGGVTDTSGSSGTSGGGGGGGGNTADTSGHAGGAGGAGLIRVWEYT